MRNTIPTLSAISWRRRPMPAAAALGLLLVFGSAPSGLAQADPSGRPDCCGHSVLANGREDKPARNRPDGLFWTGAQWRSADLSAHRTEPTQPYDRVV